MSDRVDEAPEASQPDHATETEEKKTAGMEGEEVKESSRSSSPPRRWMSNSEDHRSPESPPTDNENKHHAGQRNGEKSDSEAETIVLQEKESEGALRPLKKRKRIEHDGHSQAERVRSRSGSHHSAENASSNGGDDHSAKKSGESGPGRSSPRHSGSQHLTTTTTNTDKGNDELSRPSLDLQKESSPGSTQLPRKRKLHERRRSSAAEDPQPTFSSRHDNQHQPQPHSTEQPHQQPQKSGRRRTRSSSQRALSPHHESHRTQPARDRSHSPPARPSRRGSAQLSATGVYGLKRKRVPPTLSAPLEHRQSYDGQSDDSSASGTPPAGHRLTDQGADLSSVMSPVKAPSRKRVDQHGRTVLARMCAADPPGDIAQQLHNRPEDIDVADYAGNTPLQTASLEGKSDLVKILIKHRCDVNCKNNDKDTPLIDAVENGHLEVVRLLLGAGANPRQGNVNGEEPLDLLNSDMENYNAIKAALDGAKKNHNVTRRASEDMAGSHGGKEGDRNSSRGASVLSPRHSPSASAAPKSPPAPGPPPRRKTVRSEVTRNDLLWMKPSVENLRDRAGKGDMAGVANILNVLTDAADTESLVAAARGGHDEVMQLLLGMGGANPDGPASENYRPGWNTPMLAAIGRGNDKVIRLLLEQPKFDPTRRDHQGKRYHEIARDRQGANWEIEYQLLKDAYEKFVKERKGRKSSAGNAEGTKKIRDLGKETKRRSEGDGSEASRVKKTHAPNSTEMKTPSLAKPSVAEKPLPKPKSAYTGTAQPSAGKSDNKVRVNGHDQERSSPERERARTKPAAVKRTESDPVIGESDASKPKRKLMSSKLYKDDQERRRRASMVSTTSDDSVRPRKESLMALVKPKRESTEGSNGSGDIFKPGVAPMKNTIANNTDIYGEKDNVEKPIKMEESDQQLPNRVRPDGKQKRPRSNRASPESSSRERGKTTGTVADDHTLKKRRRLELARAQGKKIPGEKERKSSGQQDASPSSGPSRKPSDDTTAAGLSDRKPSLGHEGAAPVAPMMINLRPTAPGPEPSSARSDTDMQDRGDQQLQRETAERVEMDSAPPAGEKRDHKEPSADEDRQRKLEEEAKTAAEKAQREREAEEAKERREEEARVAAQKEAEEAEERARRAEEEERERIRREEEQARKRAEQETRRREEAERRRQEHEERQRLERIQRQKERERARLEAMPYALQRLAELPSTQLQSTQEALEALPFYSVTLSQLDRSCPAELSEEIWVSNIQAAMVLGEKDLALSRYTAWSKRLMTERQKVLLWRVVRMKLQGRAPMGLDPARVALRDRLTQAKFRILEPVFWLKLADLVDISPRYPHLHNVTLRKCCMEDLDRVDRVPAGPFAARTDVNGWTVTPYKDGKFESYSPAINAKTASLPNNVALFRPMHDFLPVKLPPQSPTDRTKLTTNLPSTQHTPNGVTSA